MPTEQNYSQAVPAVSFVVPCYNVGEDLLCQCIDSILAVDMAGGRREVIVVDDGSDVSPLPALESCYGDELLYVRQRNGGLGSARNRGLDMARGEYVQFVDADDRLVAGAYNQLLGVLRSRQPDMLIFSFTHGDTPEKSLTVSDAVSGTDYMAHHNLRATACCYLFRRTILGDLRFPTGVYHEDEAFTPYLLLRAERVCATDAEAYFYRQRPGSITADGDDEKTMKRLGDLHAIIRDMDRKADTLPPAERTALARRVAQLTMDYLYNIIRLTHSRSLLEQQTAVLRKEGLFPLPDKGYTAKYAWFRRLALTATGRALLLRLIPLLKKEK